MALVGQRSGAWRWLACPGHGAPRARPCQAAAQACGPARGQQPLAAPPPLLGRQGPAQPPGPAQHWSQAAPLGLPRCAPRARGPGPGVLSATAGARSVLGCCPCPRGGMRLQPSLGPPAPCTPAPPPRPPRAAPAPACWPPAPLIWHFPPPVPEAPACLELGGSVPTRDAAAGAAACGAAVSRALRRQRQMPRRLQQPRLRASSRSAHGR